MQDQVFAPNVFLDMSSLGGNAVSMSAREICETWSDGFKGLDAVNHLAGNHLVNTKDTTAEVFVYATATHYKESATLGKTREFVGSYDLHLTKNENGWRIDKFKYNLKYINGNTNLD